MSEVESQLRDLATQLEKAIESNNDTSNLLDLLNKLDTYEVTTNSLKTTNLGKTVNKLRKHTNADIASSSNKLVTKWKEVVKSSQNSQESQPDESNDKKRKQEDSTDSPKKSKKEKKDKKEKKHKKEKKDKKKKKSDDEDEEEQQPVVAKKIKITMSSANSPASSPKAKPEVTDPKRKKAIDMLTEKLLTKQEEDSYEASDIAAQIENELMKKYMNSNDANYKSKLLSISFNLGKNAELCASVMKGAITPIKLTTMTPQEMASDAIKELRRKIEQNNLEACQMAKPSQIETDMFKCGKCGSRKTSYFQLQTRSADEPMTTFHNCNGCGHRWRS